MSGRFVAVVLVIVLTILAMWYVAANGWRVEKANRGLSKREAPAGYFDDEQPPPPCYADNGE